MSASTNFTEFILVTLLVLFNCNAQSTTETPMSSCLDSCNSCIDPRSCVDEGPNCLYYLYWKYTLTEIEVESDTCTSAAVPISCDDRLSGLWPKTRGQFNPDYFALDIPSPTNVIFDTCNNTFDASINIYSADNKSKILNICDDSQQLTVNQCCSQLTETIVPFSTYLDIGSYFIEFAFTDLMLAETGQTEYNMDILCIDATTDPTAEPTFNPSKYPTNYPTFNPTLNPVNIHQISCNDEIDGIYELKPILFELTITSSRTVTFDACDSTLNPIISVYPFNDESNILNECMDCCPEIENSSFTTNLSEGSYYFELELREDGISNEDQDLSVYVVSVSCNDSESLETTALIIENSENSNKNERSVAVWIWIVIGIVVPLWIIILIVLIKRKRKRRLSRGMTIRTDDITLSDATETETDMDDCQDQDDNSELREFMNEEVVIDKEHYDDIY